MAEQAGQQNVIKRAMALRKAGQTVEALGLLRGALRRGGLAPEEIDKAGRFIQKELPVVAAADAPRAACRVLVLGQCTTNWLSTALTAEAWGRGCGLLTADGEYDNVLQELMADRPESSGFDFVVLVPWNARLIGGGSDMPAGQRLEEELDFWEQAWTLADKKLGARVVQVGYDWPGPGPAGHLLGRHDNGDLDLISRANDELRMQLPRGNCFVNLSDISGLTGRRTFYDPRRYFWTKQPFSEAGTVLLARHVWAAIRALRTGPKKVLILDLDNTLWGGIVGEAGPLGVALGESPDGEAFVAFQKHLKALSRRGVLLAACSKNNPEDAREVFLKNPNMALSLEDFAAFEASWQPKSAVVERMAETLNLGLDSFVFFDDNPVEREEIRHALPDVEVVEVPADPAEYVRAIEDGLWFETAGLTDADRKRSEQYRVEGKRRAAAATFASMDEYMASLEMAGEVRDIDDADMQRAVQLIGKTNQFHLTTRRHGEQDVRRLIGQAGSVGLTLRVKDRFGDYGLVSVLIAVADVARPQTLRIDTWLMSCRVIGRGVEEFFFNALLARAAKLGCRKLIGEYIPTAKNAVVKNLYDRLGFARLNQSPDAATTYELDLAACQPAKTFVKPANQ
ncbi:MAG: HAD-IIIC family phosphatase [Planctomycetes bacterium]|nr:HAD-IIIC family phosphatase [Planctomycetota bacterium]